MGKINKRKLTHFFRKLMALQDKDLVKVGFKGRFEDGAVYDSSKNNVQFFNISVKFKEIHKGGKR